MEFRDQVVLVTGAGKGLGRSIALAFAAQGAVVAANDLTPVNLDKTLALIRAQGGQAREYLFDIAKPQPVRAMVEQVLADCGRIDILVNNAGVAPRAPLLEMDEWDWQRTLDVNLSGVFYLMQAVGRAMRRQGGGVMVNLGASQQQLSRAQNQAAFCASKAGLVGLTHAAARELAAYSIRVNAVCPGEGVASLKPEDSKPEGSQQQVAVQAQLPLGHLEAGQDASALVLFLCSRAAGNINGQSFEVATLD